MVAYNARILRTSQSPQRQHRAARMLANLQPIVARLEAEARAVASRPASASTRIVQGKEFEIVWDGSLK